MRLRTVLRGLVAVTAAAVGSLVVTAQPAAAAATYFQTPLTSFNSYLAGTPRAMAVLNASTGNTVQMIQYSYSAAAPYNDLMVIEVEPGNVARIKPRHTFSNDGNVHNDKCLAILNNEPGYNQPIVNAPCSYDAINNDVWIWELHELPDFGVTVYKFRNVAYNTCIVVQNASTANNARLITHNCDLQANHVWVPYP